MVLPLLNPLVSLAEAQNTPSREDGIHEEMENDLRACKSICPNPLPPIALSELLRPSSDGAILIQQAGVLLKMCVLVF